MANSRRLPMMVQCWASVADGGPALNQHWVNVPCLLGTEEYIPVNTKHFYGICTMLDQRRRRWADVVQML